VGGLDPSACVFDIRMPGMDGRQLLSTVRQDPSLRHLKVIVTSSVRDREAVVAVGKLGIAGYLVKPYEYAATSASLKQIFGAARITLPTHAARNLLQKTILVVDDDESTRRTIKDLMGPSSKWEIVEAVDGLAGLELLRQGLRPDVAILDIKMPRLDGRSLLARIREDPSLQKTPVLMSSGMQDRELIRSLAQLRISGYLLKPIDLVKARATILQTMGLDPATAA
jgi:CheY-like chemotaxis protein